MKNLRIKYFTFHTRFCIIGGGAAGLNISAHLSKYYDPKSIRIFQPNWLHYYQAGFTMIGGDLISKEKVVCQNWRVFNTLVHWTQSEVKLINPDRKQIKTAEGKVYTYDQLIVASGNKLDWYKIKGAKQALDDQKSPVVSIYSFNTAQKTRKFAKKFKSGTAIFTQPQSPIKSPESAQMILYLLSKQWMNKKIDFQSHFYKVQQTLFPVQKYLVPLQQVTKSLNISTHFKTKLIEINQQKKQAIFLNIQNNQTYIKKFDFLHIVPPMSPHSYILDSGIADNNGYVNVDKYTLQHVKYSNIWSLGDCSNLPTTKSAAAVFSQSEILIKNLMNSLKGQPLSQKYDGYTSCPIFIGGKDVIFAYYKYDNIVTEYGQAMKTHIPNKKYYLITKYLLRYAYWYIVPTGRWAGHDIFAIDW